MLNDKIKQIWNLLLSDFRDQLNEKQKFHEKTPIVKLPGLFV